MTALYIVGGIACLYFGGDWLVNAGVVLGERLGVNRLIIGLTVMAFGTSCPELATSLGAASRGATDMAFGNVVGSNIANIGLVLGVGAMMTPIAVTRRFMMRDVPVLLGSAGLTWWFATNGVVERWEGVALLAALALYLGWLVRGARHGDDTLLEEVPDEPDMPVPKALLVALVGILLLVLGAELLVHGGVIAARTMGVSQQVIGLTLVAVGTSLPELASTVVACLKGQHDMAMGNIVGSNIFNVLAILGTTASIHPVRLWTGELVVDMTAMLLLSALVPLLTARGPARKPAGALLLSLYVGYIVLLSNRA